jgi:hypothetical protein
MTLSLDFSISDPDTLIHNGEQVLEKSILDHLVFFNTHYRF